MERFFRDSLQSFIVVMVVVLFILSVAYYLNGWQECREDGGKYVRGVMLYECVEKNDTNH